MLTFPSPHERRLAKALKPKAAVWHWVLRTCRAVGMEIERNEYLERVLNDSFHNYGSTPAAGFVFDDGCYKLQLQEKDGSFVERQCESLYEVATVVSIKTRCWDRQVVTDVPDYARIALESASPVDFIKRYLAHRRHFRLQHMRQSWIFWLTEAITQSECNDGNRKCLASILAEEYDFAVKRADQIAARPGDWIALSIDLVPETHKLLRSIREHLLKVLWLENSYAFYLLPACNDFEEVYKLLSGETGFLKGRIATMTPAQRDQMFSEDLGL
ncbi:hypothetical protein [Pseudomonas oryzihabitans]|uniref:hypothetical protein n=1 Tax=Pseudomonas oryzihabitans TaxID=47885 RepID=UPI0005865FC4|nr:hypothetical protein [Pseudomonas psychrotolerans]